MYNPDYSKVKDHDLALKLIAEYPLGLLISLTGESLSSSYLPFVVEKENDGFFLLGHLARANPQSRNLHQAKVLVSFQGPNRYISPSYYKNPQNVPTWNYAVAQIQGTAEIIDDAQQLQSILKTATDRFESANGTSWQYDPASGFNARLISAICGLKIKVNHLEGKFKLSQNRQSEDYDNVLRCLENSPRGSDQELLKWMDSTSDRPQAF